MVCNEVRMTNSYCPSRLIPNTGYDFLLFKIIFMLYEFFHSSIILQVFAKKNYEFSVVNKCQDFIIPRPCREIHIISQLRAKCNPVVASVCSQRYSWDKKYFEVPSPGERLPDVAHSHCIRKGDVDRRGGQYLYTVWVYAFDFSTLCMTLCRIPVLEGKNV